MSIDPKLQGIVTTLADSAWTLAALASATEAGIVECLTEECSVATLSERTRVPVPMLERLLDVLANLGLLTLHPGRVVPSEPLARLADDPGALRVWRDDLRRSLGQPRALIEDARARQLGMPWHHTDIELIEAQGTFARLHTKLLMAEGIVPSLDGLEERLRLPGARALDVGAGAAGNAIGFCEAWPELTVVGLEPWSDSLSCGRANVVAAGLEARIELRPARIEQLAEQSAFDFIWLPQMFLDTATLRAALERCLPALRPGGWLLTAWICDEHEQGMPAALARLRDAAFGGQARGVGSLRALLESGGYADIREKAFAGGSIGMVAGRSGS